MQRKTNGQIFEKQAVFAFTLAQRFLRQLAFGDVPAEGQDLDPLPALGHRRVDFNRSDLPRLLHVINFQIFDEALLQALLDPCGIPLTVVRRRPFEHAFADDFRQRVMPGELDILLVGPADFAFRIQNDIARVRRFDQRAVFLLACQLRKARVPQSRDQPVNQHKQQRAGDQYEEQPFESGHFVPGFRIRTDRRDKLVRAENPKPRDQDVPKNDFASAPEWRYRGDLSRL